STVSPHTTHAIETHSPLDAMARPESRGWASNCIRAMIDTTMAPSGMISEKAARIAPTRAAPSEKYVAAPANDKRNVTGPASKAHTSPMAAIGSERIGCPAAAARKFLHGPHNCWPFSSTRQSTQKGNLQAAQVPPERESSWCQHENGSTL